MPATTTDALPSLATAIDRWGERPAVIDDEGTWTYAELGAAIDRLATAYRRLGIGAGHRIVCQLPTGARFLVAAGAAWACGAVHVGAGHDLTGGELARICQRTDAAVLLYQPHRDTAEPHAALEAVAGQCPGTRMIVADMAGAGHARLDELLTGTDGGPPTGPSEEGSVELGPPRGSPLAPDDEAVLFLTSGTTSEPKAVVETSRALWAKLAHFADAYAPDEIDTHVHSLPLAHAFGFKLALTALVTGGTLITRPRFSPTDTLAQVTAHQATILPATPSHLRLLLDRLDPAVHDTGALRWVVTAAAPLPAELAQAVGDHFGAAIFHVYGCSEGFLVTTTEAGDIAAGSAGRQAFTGPPGTAPDGSVAAVDPGDGQPVATGEVGELVFGARGPVVYVGAAPVATDGWYHTGDLGRIDADGRVFVVGRVKELINRGGQQVAPGEVEAALATHPDVADCGVAGVADRVLGEALCAAIQPAGTHCPDLAHVRAFLADRLATHKQPDQLCAVTTVPRTPLGKIDRAALDQLAAGGQSRQQWRA